MNNTNKIKKNDFLRILLTETVPTDIPIIFSNDGFYRNCKIEIMKSTKKQKNELQNFTEKFFNDFIKNPVNDKNVTIPLQYKIIKNETSLRTLSLIHPSSQYKFIEFYEKFGSLICYYCGDSKTSLRAPKKIASTYYFSNRSENRKKFKINLVDTIQDEKRLKHASSYFIYAPFNHLYKFYDSNDFLNLEKKYPSMYSIDISNCFDSIYTHTISWALKTKDFSKKHKNNKSFGNEFDSIIMSINDNETNGIVVGPEFSRIFAEIILQDIDFKVILSLKEKFQIEFDVDYIIKRYIDDILIFSREKDTSNKIMKEYIDQLYLYKLHLNEKKTKNYVRPFHTKKSILVILIRNKINELNNNIVYYTESSICPKLIKYPDIFSRKFINEIKLICSTNNEDYSQISNYLISAFFNKTLAIMEANISNEDIDEEIESKYKNFFIFILKVVYFFYSVSPTIKSSYKISKIIILIPKFLEEKFPVSAPTIKQLIIELSIDLFNSDSHLKYMDRDKFVLLEKLNIIIAIGELGYDYLLPEKFIEKIFLLNNKNISYFEIMSCLFYIKNHNDYNSILSQIKNIIIEKITDLSDIKQNSEKVYLFLDTLSCPYLDLSFKIKLINKIKGMERKPNDLKKEVIDYYIENPWFIHWRSVDLLKILEKKLYSVY